MTVKELRHILDNYSDRQPVVVTVKDIYDSILVSAVKEDEWTPLNALELIATIPPGYSIIAEETEPCSIQ